jgi:DnaJ-class molecular chaperone
MRNPLDILECSSKSTPEEITKKFKKLAMKYHPDRNSTLDEQTKKEYENQFKEINCAFTYLKNNNFKYDTSHADFEKYSNIFKSKIFKNGIGIGNIFQNFRNINFDSIANNILKGINDFQGIYDNSNSKLTKTDDISINANIELFDIYNNVKKEISIDINKKCSKCMALGYNIDTKAICSECNGKKIIITHQALHFYSMFKNIKLKSMGNEALGKRPGNIYINIFCKKHQTFRIIDDYNLLNRISILQKENISHNEDGVVITIPIQFLDLKQYNIIIKNPATSLSLLYEYEIDGYGLYIPNKTRGKLIIEVIDPNNYIGHFYTQYEKTNKTFNYNITNIDTQPIDTKHIDTNNQTSVEFNLIS